MSHCEICQSERRSSRRGDGVGRRAPKPISTKVRTESPVATFDALVESVRGENCRFTALQTIDVLKEKEKQAQERAARLEAEKANQEKGTRRSMRIRTAAAGRRTRQAVPMARSRGRKIASYAFAAFSEV